MHKSDSTISTPASGPNRCGLFVDSEHAQAQRAIHFHYDIKTVLGLVEVLGGETAVATELDVVEPVVRDWAISGSIPTGWHLRLFARVCALGKTVSPAVFNFRYDDEAGLALSDLMVAARRAAEGGHDHV